MSSENNLSCASNETDTKRTITNTSVLQLNNSLSDFMGMTICNSTTGFNTTLQGITPEMEEHDFIPHHKRPETYIVPVLFALIFVVGILGNGTLIRIFLKYRNMRNVPNMYICSLAVGDILVILFCVPFTSTLYTLDSWPYGTVVCKFSEYTKDVSIGVSVFTLTALSADRYLAIADPMRKLSGRRATKINLITIIGIWIFSLLIALPSGLYSYVHVIEGPLFQLKICYPFPPELGAWYPKGCSQYVDIVMAPLPRDGAMTMSTYCGVAIYLFCVCKIVVLCKFLVYYAIPLLFIATFHIIMARHLLLSTRNMPGEVQGQAKAIQARKKVAKMVLAFVVIFALCFFPSHVFFLWFYFHPNAEYSFNGYWNALRIIGFCLGFINSCVNPITLYCVSATFRKYFNQHLFCCFSPRNPRLGIPDHNQPRLLKILSCGCDCDCLWNNCAYSEGHRQPLHSHSGTGTTATGTHSAMKSKSTWDCQSVASHNQIMTMSHSQSAASGLGSLTTNKFLSLPNANPPALELKSSPEETLANANTNTNSSGYTNSFPLVTVQQHNASVHSHSHSNSAVKDIMTTSFTTNISQPIDTDSSNTITYQNRNSNSATQRPVSPYRKCVSKNSGPSSPYKNDHAICVLDEKYE